MSDQTVSDYERKRGAFYGLQMLGQEIKVPFQYVTDPWSKGYYDRQFFAMRDLLEILLEGKEDPRE